MKTSTLVFDAQRELDQIAAKLADGQLLELYDHGSDSESPGDRFAVYTQGGFSAGCVATGATPAAALAEARKELACDGTVVCTNDRYTPAANEFDSVEDFLAYCLECFGEEPNLLETSPGIWTDMNTGEHVLQRSDLAPCERCSGSGREPQYSRLGDKRCQSCKGAGYVETEAA